MVCTIAIAYCCRQDGGRQHRELGQGKDIRGQGAKAAHQGQEHPAQSKTKTGMRPVCLGIHNHISL